MVQRMQTLKAQLKRGKVKMQSNFNHIRKDTGYLDKEELKQKLI